MELNKMNRSVLNLPQNINIVVWKKKNEKDGLVHINVFNESKNINLFVTTHKNKFKFDKNTNSIIIIKKEFNLYDNNKICKFFFNFIKSWNLYYFNKIKFKGKGFRMRFLKKNKFVKFFFGRSHKTFILFKKIAMKKINKYKFILKSIHKQKLLKNCKIVTRIKPLNVYTIRGLRKTRQIIFKRKGKKGTYI